MAQEGNLERRCSDTVLKIQAVIRRFVGSLTEILNAEDLFEDEANVIGNLLCQTGELKNQWEEQLRRLRADTPSRVASAFKRDERDYKLAGSSLHSKRARCAYPEGEVFFCRHFCKDHPQVMDITLWETLPAEVVERICAMLPLSKIFELLKLCEPWSRLPTASRFRQFCAKAHGDLFGIVIFSENALTYRLAIYDSKHEEWSYSKMSSIPFDCLNMFDECDNFVFGRDGGLMCVIPHHMSNEYFLEGKYEFFSPCVLVFNPLTGDKKYIGVSSLTASIEKERVYAVLLQLIMDEEVLGCYKLILVTEVTKPSGGTVYYSESYNSVSGVWSTLDHGCVYGDGVLVNTRYHVCFDCRLKKFCTPAEHGKSVRNPHSHVYFTNVHPDYRYDPSCTFVRDHRFKLEFVEDTTEENLIFTAEISESVWQNGWNEKSIVELEMEMPYGGFATRLLACTRYVLVIADVGGHGYEDCRHHMVLYDRVTSRDCDIPQFQTTDYDVNFMHRNIQFMCDLKWDGIP